MLKEASITLPANVDPRKAFADEYARTEAEARHEKAVRKLLTRIVKLWGGYTITEGAGGWLSPEGELVTEDVAVVTFAVPAGINDQPGPADSVISQLAAVACVALDQQAVYYRYPDGEAVILERAVAEALVAASDNSWF